MEFHWNTVCVFIQFLLYHLNGIAVDVKARLLHLSSTQNDFEACTREVTVAAISRVHCGKLSYIKVGCYFHVEFHLMLAINFI